MSDLLTTRQVADMLGIAEWRVRRLFESGSLPEPQKFGGKRMILRALIPAIVDALRSRDWLQPTEAKEQENGGEAGQANPYPEHESDGA